ncbi:GNAT family N-acetyltransferase [Neisseriaceae bacterium PsAf]|nr:GNAT family N-acetyltransferase [Neisseriaceae bacterium PsAf]
MIVRLAKNKKEIRQAQKLRYKIFAEELGAKLDTKKPGFDIDKYDKYCLHLLVIDENKDKIVGTYRILTPEGAKKAGSWYGSKEFCLSPLEPIMPKMLETGRVCVHKDYRLGSAVLLLWSGLIGLAQQMGYQYLVGSGSISMQDGGARAASVYKKIQNQDKVISEDMIVTPINPLAVDEFEFDKTAEIPTLIRGYLKLGASIGGVPGVDPDFKTADVLIIFDINQANQRYLKKIMGSV